MSRSALVALVIANLFVALQTVGVVGAAPLGSWELGEEGSRASLRRSA